MVSTIIAAIGTTGLYWQIRLTRKAVQETSEATKAMREANSLAREAQDRQLRPYITFTEPGDADAEPFSRETKLWFSFKNFGTIPASQVLLSVGAQNFTLPIGQEEVWLEKFGFFGSLAPGDARKDFVHVRDAHVRDISELASGSRKLVFRMRLEYWWSQGFDSDEWTMVLVDPARNDWKALTFERRQEAL